MAIELIEDFAALRKLMREYNIQNVNSIQETT
jgi:hypothetical protein